MNFFRKLKLSEDFSNKLLDFADYFNLKILNLSEAEYLGFPIYWHISKIDNSFTYGYIDLEENEIKIPIGIQWNDLDFKNWPGYEIFEKFNIANLFFCLYRHNFPLHRHGEVYDREHYLRYSLVISKIDGQLILGDTIAPTFEIPEGFTTEINHISNSEQYTVREIVDIRKNDVFIFDTTQWHTFSTFTPINKNNYTLTVVLSDLDESSLNSICNALES